MKLAIINWPLNDVGGIDSWIKNFCKGVKILGHEIDCFYATEKLKFQCDPKKDIVKARCSVIAAHHLSYHPKHVKESLESLNKYDLIVFGHPSPHPTKSVLSCEHHLNWKLLYQVPQPPKLTIFHDLRWHKNNVWIQDEDVSCHMNGIVAAQKAFYNLVTTYPNQDIPKKWFYFPLDFSMANIWNKRISFEEKHGIAVCPQWVKMKNHGKFLPLLKYLDIPVSFYGNGIEYYQLKKSGVFQEAICEDHYKEETYNKDSIHNFYGFVPYSKIIGEMCKSQACIDLSINGTINMTYWEPMTVRTLSFMERRVVEREDNAIPEDCLAAFDLDNVIEDIKRTLGGRYRRTVDNAFKFARKAECSRVVKGILDWSREEGII